jgi:hypothetical protein
MTEKSLVTEKSSVPVEARRVPASAGHRLLRLMERVGGAEGALNVPGIYRLRGRLRVPALLDALRALPVRHEALRTTFAGRGPELTQIVHSPLPQPPEVLLFERTSESELAGAVERETRHRFALDREWPVRLRLFEVAPDDHVLLINVHHIATDGLSMGVLADDLRGLYDAGLGLTDATPEPPAWQQADFTEWQRRRSTGGALDGAIRYWQETLGDAQPSELPATLTVPAADPAAEPGLVDYQFSGEITSLLRQAAKRHRCTTFTGLLAAFCWYFGRLADEAEVVVPTMFGNRAHPDAQRTVGYIGNLLLLRLNVGGEPTFSDVLRQARRAMLGALANQEVPYHIVPMTSGDTAGRRAPRMLLEYLDAPGGSLTLTGLDVSNCPDLGRLGSRLTIEFHFTLDGDVLRVKCSYSPDGTSKAAIERFLDRFSGFAARSCRD